MDVFHVDNHLVRESFNNDKNYIIDINNVSNKNYCMLYFSSNGLYFPNNEETFTREVIQRNRFEWKNNKVDWVKKNIFIRDIYKQWYIEGINKNINSIEKLEEFLREETRNYKVITVGSSAGGYAAILFGILLDAEYVISFSPQISLQPQIDESGTWRDPLLFKYMETSRSNYYDLSKFIQNSSVPIYYIAPFYSDKDKPQIKLASEFQNIKTLYFNSKIHGVPVKIPCAAKIISMHKDQLDELFHKHKDKILNPIIFTVRVLGLHEFCKYLVSRVVKRIFRKSRK